MGELTARMRGDGKIFCGAEFLTTSSYEVRVFQEYVDVTTQGKGHAKIPAVKYIDCDLMPFPHMAKIGSRLTLHMDDGRKLDFLVVGANSLKPTGSIY